MLSMGKLTISMVIFHSYDKLPDGTDLFVHIFACRYARVSGPISSGSQRGRFVENVTLSAPVNYPLVI